MSTTDDAIRNTHPSFRGWTKPGPLPDEEAMRTIPREEGETLDALSGHFRIFQLRKGHRFSTDDILTAWYGTTWCPSATRALDLGSGLGTVAMIVAWRLPAVEVVGVEAQDQSIALAKKSRAYNGLEGRYEIRRGDFRTEGLEAEERFDLITGTPPYFPLETGVTSEHPQKVACRFEVRGGIADYCAVAARHLAPGGTFACVFPERPDAQLERVVEGAAQAGLAIVRRRPIIMREGDAPLLSLFAMHRRADLPEQMHARTHVEPALTIRRLDGSVDPKYAAVKLAIGFPP